MQKSHKRIIENIFSLGMINGINLLIPLVTLPYLIQHVGLSNYGAYSIVYSMLQYGILFSAYGFGFSTTQQIAQHRDNKSILNVIVNSTLAARLLIMLIVSIVMGVVCIVVYPREYFIMYLLGLGVILGDIMNPVWLYQGMEKMRFMTIVHLVSKIVFTLLIFVFIKENDDYPYITLLNSVGYIVAGCLSLIMAYRSFKLTFRLPKRRHVMIQFKSGWYIFLSTISMNLYRNSNVFILGFFLPSAQVGLYSGAEKIVKGFQAIISPLSNALFPYVARKFKDMDIKERWRAIRRMSGYISILLIVLSVILYFTTPWLNVILLKGLDSHANYLIRLMIPVLLFGGLNYILGIVGLVNSGEKKGFFNCVMTSGVISILLLFGLIEICGVDAAAWSMTGGEILLFVMCLWKWHGLITQCKTKNIQYDRNYNS